MLQTVLIDIHDVPSEVLVCVHDKLPAKTEICPRSRKNQARCPNLFWCNGIIVNSSHGKRIDILLKINASVDLYRLCYLISQYVFDDDNFIISSHAFCHMQET